MYGSKALTIAGRVVSQLVVNIPFSPDDMFFDGLTAYEFTGKTDFVSSIGDEIN